LVLEFAALAQGRFWPQRNSTFLWPVLNSREATPTAITAKWSYNGARTTTV
jgi:hypothetical protein